jgi:hypothetical protein
VIAHADHHDRRPLGLERNHRQPAQAGVPEQPARHEQHIGPQQPQLADRRRQVSGDADGLEPGLGLEQRPQRRPRRAAFGGYEDRGRHPRRIGSGGA